MTIFVISQLGQKSFSTSSYPVQQNLYQKYPAQPLHIELMCRGIFQCSFRYKFSQDSHFSWSVQACRILWVFFQGGFPCHLTSQNKTTRMSSIVSHFLILSPIIFICKTQTSKLGLFTKGQQAHNNTRVYLNLSRENSTYPKLKTVHPLIKMSLIISSLFDSFCCTSIRQSHKQSSLLFYQFSKIPQSLYLME